MNFLATNSKNKLWTLALVLFLMAVALCFAGCSSGGSGSTSNSEVEQKDDGFSIVAVYHPQTGMSEPAGYASIGTTDYNTALKNLKSGEEESDFKHIFVAIEIEPDERQNIDIPSGKALGTGDSVSGATLTIDDLNEYDDNWALNNTSTTRKVYNSQLMKLGYTDGTTPTTLYGGASEPYRAIFVFDISTADLEKGEVGYLKWHDYSAKFNMADIQTVEKPLDMVDELAALQQ